METIVIYKTNSGKLEPKIFPALLVQKKNLHLSEIKLLPKPHDRLCNINRNYIDNSFILKSFPMTNENLKQVEKLMSSIKSIENDMIQKCNKVKRNSNIEMFKAVESIKV